MARFLADPKQSGMRSAGRAVAWFVRRHAIPLGFTVSAVILVVATRVLRPAAVSEDIAAVARVGFVALAAVVAIIVSVRSDRVQYLQGEALEASEGRHRLLAAAVEQTAEAVVISDPAGLIMYVNPAFERVTGYAAHEAIGQNPRFLQSGRHPVEFYEQMWSVLTSGQTWTGELINRRKDGATYVDEATITPVLDATGRIATFVAVQRDVTQVRSLQTSLTEIARERAGVAASLAGLSPDGTLEQRATAICTELTRLPGVDVAALDVFEGAADVVTLGVSGMRIPPGMKLPKARAARLRDRAASGPWIESWRVESGEGAFGVALGGAGVRAVAISPIANGAGPVGTLLVGATSEEHAEHIVERLPALVEFAATTQGLLGPALLERRERSAMRERIRAMLDSTAFRPVFQPVVEIATGRTVGFEALTRFDDGTAPDRVFAAAARTGLGPELEAATLVRALECAADLPPGPWLSLNASPAFVVSGDLRRILAHRTRSIVIEITEHDPIDDYQAVREAIAALGPDVRLAVDDAGAGIANFGHIVEMRADIVKLDATLIRGVDADPTRQALVSGLHDFAHSMDHFVIAEAVETEEELATLRSLDVRFGQGFILGRPAPAATFAVEPPRVPAADEPPPVPAADEPPRGAGRRRGPAGRRRGPAGRLTDPRSGTRPGHLPY